jgi:hypothetical protein
MAAALTAGAKLAVGIGALQHWQRGSLLSEGWCWDKAPEDVATG